MLRFPLAQRLLPAGVLLALFALLPGCGGGDGGGSSATPPPPPPPAPVATVQFAGTAPGPLVVGSTTQLQARTLDAAGGVLGGRPVTWVSAAPAVATVSGTGLVTAVAPGETQVTATSEGRSAQIGITVIPPPVASVEVTPGDLELEAGDTATLTATLRDAAGNALTGRAVVWASSATGVATVDAEGLLTAVAPGEAVLTATSEERTGGANVVVFSATAPRVSSIEPAMLVEGETATVTGVRFAPSPAGNQVRIGGVAAQVLSASATQLTVRVPEGACLPEGAQPVQIEVGAESVERGHPFRPAAFLEVPVGELRILRAPSDLCLQLPATGGTGDWLVGVQSVSLTATAVAPVTVSTRTGSLVAGAPPFRGAPLPRAVAPPAVPFTAFAAPPRLDPEAEAMEERHMAFLQRQAEMLEEFRRQGAPLAAPGSVPAAVPASVQIGDVVEVKMPNFSNICGLFFPTPAVVRARGQRTIILEDMSNPEGGYTAEQYAGISELMDNLTIPSLEENFGAFTDFDGNGRVVILVTRRVNEAGVAGFASGGDFLPQCAASNNGEYLYISAPDPGAGSTSGYFPANALRDLPRLTAHELTHVIQVGRRTPQGRPQMGPWEIEGQARYAEEVLAFQKLGVAPRQNLGFDFSRGEDPEGGTFWFRAGFNNLYRYFGFLNSTTRIPEAPERCGWLGYDIIGVLGSGASGPCQQSLNYGLGQSFLRWVTDHFAGRVGGDAALHQGLIGTQAADMPALAGLVGEDRRDLLAYWAATLYTDGRFDGLEPRLTYPSWNLAELQNRWWATGRLEPYIQGFEPLDRSLTIAAGSSAYLRVSGANQPGTAIQVRSPSGAPLPTFVQLWVVRLP